MAKKRAKNGSVTENDRDSDCAVAVDRISKLPDHVICHILSFVPTVDAVRMSVLSRRWRRMWHSVPTLQFSFGVGNVFVEKCLKHRRRAMRFVAGSAVTTFKLDIICSHKQIGGLSKWFGSNIIMNNVKQLEFCLESECLEPKHYLLPSPVLNGRSLTRLNLEGYLRIDDCPMNLPFLKYLCLIDVDMDTKILNNLLAGCPSLEECALKNIHVLEIRISSQSLKVLEIQSECEAMHIEAVNLQRLVADCCFCREFDISACKAVRDLSVLMLRSDLNHTYEDQISNLSFLENLTLRVWNWDGFTEMNISNPNLKHFSLLKEHGEEFKLKIETPNLVSLHYMGHMNCSMSVRAANHNLDARFYISYSSKVSYGTKWYKELIEFLSNIDCSGNSVADLYVDDDKALIVPEDLKRTCNRPRLKIKHLQVTTLKKLTRRSKLRKSLEWIFPSLETLSILKNPTDSTEWSEKFVFPV